VSTLRRVVMAVFANLLFCTLLAASASSAASEVDGGHKRLAIERQQPPAPTTGQRQTEPAPVGGRGGPRARPIAKWGGG